MYISIFVWCHLMLCYLMYFTFVFTYFTFAHLPFLLSGSNSTHSLPLFHSFTLPLFHSLSLSLFCPPMAIICNLAAWAEEREK